MTTAQLRQLDLGGEPVPLLAEALERCSQLGLWANVELKVPTGGDEVRLGQVVGRALAEQWNGHGVISSFSAAALLAAKSQSSRYAYALLVESVPDDWQRLIVDTGAVAVHANAARINTETIAAIRKAGLDVACYTMNDRHQTQALLAAGVSAIFTDRPDLWRRNEM
jgi:glycerophosphoryl diester phosphodiesterase